MYQKYTAFISYRHHPLDSAIAEDVLRRLERFHVPAAIRRMTGKRSIGRIFRDKAELAITSDINEDILQSLASSEYLIVICSGHTAESIWVQREIETFLATHDHSHVLTVLAEGEPQDVIPEALRWQEVTGEDGTVQRVPVEPLSCDFRGYTTDRAARRTARREELPRLAAALLGCPYDALRQRQRQYQMRRLALAFSLALLAMAALTGYFLWSSLRIQENYEQALRSQSMYLAEEALRLVDAGDRLTALHLALEALPSPAQPRPLVPRAEYALGVATAAYTIPGNGSIAAVCSFEHDSTVTDFALSADSSRLFVLDASNAVTVWDTDGYQQLWRRSWDSTPALMRPAANDTVVLLLFENELVALDSTSGQELWRTAPQLGELAHYNEYCLLLCDGGSGVYVAAEWSDEQYISRSMFQHIDVRTGSILDGHPLPELPEGLSDWYFFDPVLSVEEQAVAFILLETTEDYDLRYCIAVLDLTTDAVTVMEQDLAFVAAMAFAPGGDLLVLGHVEETDTSYYISSTAVSYEAAADLLCLDSRTGKEKWAADFVTSQVNYYSALEPLQLSTPDGPLYAVCCVSAERWLIVSLSDGSVLASWTLPAEAVGVSVSSTGLRGVLMSGQWSTVSMENSYVLSSDLFADDLIRAAVGSCVVTQQRGESRLLLYRDDVADASWQPIESGAALGYSVHLADTPAGVLLYSGSQACLLEPGTLAELWSLEWDSAQPLGLSRDGSLLLYRIFVEEKSAFALMQLHIADGSSSPIEADIDAPGSLYYCEGAELFLDDSWNEELEPVLRMLRIDGSEAGALALPQEMPTVRTVLSDPASALALLSNNDTNLLLADFEAGTLIPLENEINDAPTTAAWAADYGRLAVVTGDTVSLYTTDGARLWAVPMNGPAALHFTDGGKTLLIAAADNSLYRCDADTGAQLDRCQLAYVDALNDNTRWYATGDGYLVVCSGSVATVVETSDWVTSAYVADCAGYLPAEDSFITAVTRADMTSVGLFPRHTVEDLIARAQEQLGDHRLDEDTLREYGLPDS